MRFIVVFALLLIAPGFYKVETNNSYYVDVHGNDASGDGSKLKPWRTLKCAISNIKNGTVKLSAGIFIEAAPLNVPNGVSIEGAGRDLTIIKCATSFHFHSEKPGYTTDKFLIRLVSPKKEGGGQLLKDITIDGDSRQLHGGIFVQNRSMITVQNVLVKNTNFSAIWFNDVDNSKIKDSKFINCSWGSSDWCSGAINIGGLEKIEIDNCFIDEGRGYGIKALSTSDKAKVSNLKIQDCHITVNPFGLWKNGKAPNIAIELWGVELENAAIFNCYVDNTISIVNNFPFKEIQSVHIYNNVLDMDKRAKGQGYGIELSVDNAEVDHNYFVKGTRGIANWEGECKNWSIHHNIFYGLAGTYPAEALRSQSGLTNLKFYNNTMETIGDKTTNLISLYGGVSSSLELKNNLVINNNTSFSHYPNRFLYLEKGASVKELYVINNLFYKLNIGNVVGTYKNNLSKKPLIVGNGERPTPYYNPKVGSPLIDSGVDVGFDYDGVAPDIGAVEFKTLK